MSRWVENVVKDMMNQVCLKKWKTCQSFVGGASTDQASSAHLTTRISFLRQLEQVKGSRGSSLGTISSRGACSIPERLILDNPDSPAALFTMSPSLRSGSCGSVRILFFLLQVLDAKMVTACEGNPSYYSSYICSGHWHQAYSTDQSTSVGIRHWTKHFLWGLKGIFPRIFLIPSYF